MKFNIIPLLLFTFVHPKHIHNGRIINNNNYHNNKGKIINNQFDNDLTIASSSSKACLPSCEDFSEFTLYTKKSECVTVNTYCIDKENQIFGISTINKCLRALHDIYLFEIKSTDEIKIIDLYNDKVRDPSNLCLYQCEVQCKQSNGYVKVDNKTYKNSTYYYVDTNKSGIATPVDIKDKNECSSHIGELVKYNNVNHYEICITNNSSIPLDFYYGDVILSGKINSNSPFTEKSNNDDVDIVITYDYNYVITETQFNFYNGYLLVSNRNYLKCDQNGCRIKSKFVDSCDDEDNIGKLAKFEEKGLEKIFICSHFHNDNKIEIPYDDYYKNDDLDIKLYESVYYIEKGFPGTAEDSKTFASVWFNNIYCNIGVNLNTDKDSSGKEFISSIISICDIDDDNIYKCEDKNTIPGDYYYEQNTFLLYKVVTEDKMEQVDSLDGIYVNHNEYFFYAMEEPWFIIYADDIEEEFSCYENSGYIYYSPSPMLCLSTSTKVELSDENYGKYLLYISEDHPFSELIEDNEEETSYRIITISNNKAVLDRTNEKVSYCLDENLKLTIKDNKCNGKEVSCYNSICTKPFTKTNNEDLDNNLNRAISLHISPFIILISILLTLYLNL